MPSDEEWIKDLQRRLTERKREEREERQREEREEREEQEQDQRLPAAGDRPRLETLANPRPSPSQPAADTTPGGGLDRDDPFGEVTGGAAAMRSHVTPPAGGGGTSEREATSISFEGGAATTGASAGVAQTSTNADTSANHADLDDAALTMVSATADATAAIPENASLWDESDDQKVEFG